MSTRNIRMALALAAVLVAGLLPATSNAVTTARTPLHRLAEGVYGLSSDGVRYAAWTTDYRLTTYDSDTGRRHHIAFPVRCAPQIVAMHDGEALISCYPSPWFIVDLASGKTTTFGSRWSEYSPEAIGSRWIQTSGRCNGSLSEDCETFIDRTTGDWVQKPVPWRTVFDLDANQPGLWVRCSPTHGRYTTPTYDGRNYLFDEPKDGLGLGRCGGPSKTLSPEVPFKQTIGGGVVTWLDGIGNYAYVLATHRTYQWKQAGTVADMAHTRTAVFIAHQTWVGRAANYRATLLTARLPSSKSR